MQKKTSNIRALAYNAALMQAQIDQKADRRKQVNSERRKKYGF